MVALEDDFVEPDETVQVAVQPGPKNLVPLGVGLALAQVRSNDVVVSHHDDTAKGANPHNRLPCVPGTAKTYNALKVVDGNGGPVVGLANEFTTEVRAAGGGVVAGFTVAVIDRTNGKYQVKITPPGAIPAGNYNVSLKLPEKYGPLGREFVYIEI